MATTQTTLTTLAEIVPEITAETLLILQANAGIMDTLEVKDTGGLTDIAIQEVMVSEVKNCPASAILGESDPRVDTLRQFRDNVLIKSPEGQEIIKLYYQWSPVIVKAMEVDKEFKAEVKEMVDGVLELIE